MLLLLLSGLSLTTCTIGIIMPRLIQLRQRIRTIETIKKITHAMRLISMSSHSHMRHAREPLNTYVTHLSKLLARILQEIPTWNHPLMQTDHTAQPRTLTIIVGSQKSLCGNFNTALAQHVRAYMDTAPKEQHDMMAIGKKMIDLLANNAGLTQWTATYPTFTMRALTSVTRALSYHILNASPAYTNVKILSNYSHSFFMQRPRTNVVVPLSTAPSEKHTNNVQHESFEWDQSPTMILPKLLEQYLESQIHLILFESLLAEQAARFVSMDSSTRNANNMLGTMHIQYNKLRQAKITKELTELSSSFT